MRQTGPHRACIAPASRSPQDWTTPETRNGFEDLAAAPDEVYRQHLQQMGTGALSGPCLAPNHLAPITHTRACAPLSGPLAAGQEMFQKLQKQKRAPTAKPRRHRSVAPAASHPAIPIGEGQPIGTETRRRSLWGLVELPVRALARRRAAQRMAFCRRNAPKATPVASNLGSGIALPASVSSRAT